eukprot:scaffold482_cov266-Amphora_coffeaeformis.AAC.47
MTSKRLKILRRLLLKQQRRRGVDKNNISGDDDDDDDDDYGLLKELSISFCVLPNGAVQQELTRFIQSKPGLQSVSFCQNEVQGGDNDNDGDSNLNFLWKALQGRTLQEVELQDRTIYGTKGEAFVQALLGHVSMHTFKLKGMSLDTAVIRGICTALQSPTITVLRELSLPECWLDDEMLGLLVDCFVSSTPFSGPSLITTLDLESNSFTPAAVPHLTRLLGRGNTTTKNLQTLILDRNENLFFGVNSETAAAFGEAVATNTTLQTLSMSLTDLGDTVAIPLFKALEVNTTLHVLDFTDTFLSVRGYEQFVASLSRLRGVRQVSVGWDELFDEFPPTLQADAWTALERNTSILKFNDYALSYNQYEHHIEAPQRTLYFYATRNHSLLKARHVLELSSPLLSSSNRHENDNEEDRDEIWKWVVPHMASRCLSNQNAYSAASAVYTILRHCLPTHAVRVLPLVTRTPPSPKKKKKKTVTMRLDVSFEDDDDDDSIVQYFLDQEDVLGIIQ